MLTLLFNYDVNMDFQISEIFKSVNDGFSVKTNFLFINKSPKELLKDVSGIYGSEGDIDKVKKISYRVFDDRCFYSQSINIHNFIESNIGLVLSNHSTLGSHNLQVFISNKIVEAAFLSDSINETTFTFPLYLYPEASSLLYIQKNNNKTPNLNSKIVVEIAQKIGLTYVPEMENGSVCFATNNDELRDEFKQVFAPIDILDYIYAVLHSPTYRTKHNKTPIIDFPRIPYPKDVDIFWKLVKLVGEIRKIHLLESPVLDQFAMQYPVEGTNQVLSPNFLGGRVYFNKTQYFDNVPETAWNFYIGSYQPAQKWLLERRNEILTFNDILHYKKIIFALAETDRIMKEINGIGIE